MSWRNSPSLTFSQRTKNRNVFTARGVPALRLGWPTAEIGHRDGFSAVVDHNAFDAPGETRHRIERMLRLFKRKLDRPQKKHRIDSW
jgi:hypothetical protein